MGDTNFGHLRRDYGDAPLEHTDIPHAPGELIDRWIRAAAEAGQIEPNGLSLATCDADGMPHCRVVLCKQLEPDSLVFFTNRQSDKGRQLQSNPRAAATFWWSLPRARQVRIEGGITPVADSLSDSYFASRPRQAQLAASASPQSEAVADREELERLLQAADVAAGDGPIARPAHWGGYRLQFETIEFWQGRDGRLHDRFRCRLHDGSWTTIRLAP